jgi:hypothetical protein
MRKGAIGVVQSAGSAAHTQVAGKSSSRHIHIFNQGLTIDPPITISTVFALLSPLRELVHEALHVVRIDNAD